MVFNWTSNIAIAFDIQTSARSLGPSLNISRQLTALSLPPFQGMRSHTVCTIDSLTRLIPGRQHSGIDVGAGHSYVLFL